MSGLKMIKLSLFVIILACASVTAFAQEFRGSISGRVTEGGGAAVANAQITVTNVATNASVSSTTKDSGEYQVLYLIPGNYTLSVEVSL